MDDLYLDWWVGTLAGILLALGGASGLAWIRHETRPQRIEEFAYLAMPRIQWNIYTAVKEILRLLIAAVAGFHFGMGSTVAFSTFIWGHSPPIWVGYILFPLVLIFSVVGSVIIIAKPYPDKITD